MEPLSEQRLMLCNPELVRRVHLAAEQLAEAGTYFRVASGLRTYDQQNALYLQGRDGKPGHIVTNARGGYSNHNFGCAVDCYPFLTGQAGDLNWDPTTPQFLAMVKALKAQGLAWGGDWISLHDFPHFQLANVPVTPTAADRTAYARGGNMEVWAMYETKSDPLAPVAV